METQDTFRLSQTARKSLTLPRVFLVLNIALAVMSRTIGPRELVGDNTILLKAEDAMAVRDGTLVKKDREVEANGESCNKDKDCWTGEECCVSSARSLRLGPAELHWRRESILISST